MVQWDKDWTDASLCSGWNNGWSNGLYICLHGWTCRLLTSKWSNKTMNKWKLLYLFLSIGWTLIAILNPIFTLAKSPIDFVIDFVSPFIAGVCWIIFWRYL